jgi:hypothetical protein
MSDIDVLANDVKRFLETIIEGQVFRKEPNSKGDGFFIYGPIFTLLVMVGIPDRPNGFIVSVNGDPGFLVELSLNLTKVFPELEYLGSFCEAVDGSGRIVMGDEVLAMREEHIMLQALMIAKTREAETKGNTDEKILVPNKQIIVPG